MQPTSAPSEKAIRVKNPTAPTAAVPVASPAVSPQAAPPVVEPLTQAMSRLATTIENDVRAALSVYRSHIVSLSNDVRLSGAEMDALAHATRVLSLTADDVRRDVLAIRSHRDQLKALAEIDRQGAELSPQQAGWNAEEEAIKKRLTEIQLLRKRLLSLQMGYGQRCGEVDRFAKDNCRVLGSLAEAVAAHTAQKATGGVYQPRTIRNEPPTAIGPVVGVQIPDGLID